MDAPDLLQALQGAPMDSFGQAGMALQGFASGVQGQQNPALQLQQQQSRDRIAVAGVMMAAERERRANKEFQLKLLQDIPDSTPEARTIKYQGLSNMLKETGGQSFPDSMLQSLIAGKLNKGDLEGISKLVARQMSPENILKEYPQVPRQTVMDTLQLYQQDPDKFLSAINLPTLTKQRHDADAAKLESVKLLQAERARDFPELSGPAESFILQAHVDLNHGQDYAKGTINSRTTARTEGFQRLLKMKAAEAQARAGEHLQVEPTGGVFYDTRTRQTRSAVRVGEMETSGGAIHSINATEWQRKDYAERAGNSIMGLKVLLPKLLASHPGSNLTRALKLQMESVVASNPDLRQFHDLVFKVDVELSRVLSGSGIVRQRMLELVSKYAGIATTDTKFTATRLLDNNLIDMENARRGVLQDPGLPLLPLTGARRIGPGTYWAKDLRTGSETPVPINLKPGQISPDYYEILREK